MATATPAAPAAVVQRCVFIDVEMDALIPDADADAWTNGTAPRATCVVSRVRTETGAFLPYRWWSSAVATPPDAVTPESVVRASDGLAPFMSRADVRALFAYLEEEVAAGATLVTWGGTHGDFRVLGLQGECVPLAARLALGAVDLAISIFAVKGSLVSLDAAAAATDLGSKRAGASSSAPVTWAMPSPIARRKVLRDCETDVRLTAGVYCKATDNALAVIAAAAAAMRASPSPQRPSPAATAASIAWMWRSPKTKSMVCHVAQLPATAADGVLRLDTVARCLARPPQSADVKRRLSHALTPAGLAAWATAACAASA